MTVTPASMTVDDIFYTNSATSMTEAAGQHDSCGGWGGSGIAYPDRDDAPVEEGVVQCAIACVSSSLASRPTRRLLSSIDFRV
jgi:hypothetical protein